KEAYNIINKSSSVAILCKKKWDFPVVFASENTEKLFGYSSTEFLSNQIKIHELVYPDDLNDTRAYFFKLLKSEDDISSKPVSFRIITKEGKIKWIETSLDTIRNSKNKVTHIQGIAEDITERKITEDLFFKSNQRLKDQFNNTPLASIIWDLDFKVLEWNNSAHMIFGYSPEEAIGKHSKDLIILPSISDKIDEIWENLLAQKAGFRSKNENITKSGQIIICDWYNVTLKDADGQVIGVASLADDITERTHSKILLEKSEKKYRDIFEKSIDAVLIIKDNIFADCNMSTLKVFGYPTKKSLVEVHPSKLSPEKQPDGRDSFEKAEEMMQIAIDEGSHRFRWYHKQKNGHVFPAEVTLTKIEEVDSKITIHVVIKDITERVKKEEIENILYNISKAALSIDDFNEFGYFIKDELHKIINTNNFFIALYNEEDDSFYTPVVVDEFDDIAKFKALRTLSGYVVKSKKSLLFTNESHKKLIEQGEVDLVGVDSKIWLGVPLKTQDKIFGVMVVQSYTNENAYNENDVQLLEFVADQISSTIQRKNTDNDLKMALKKAQESDRLKSAFLANMSHEIRTPMNGIIGFSELFLNPDLSYSQRKDYANIVINSSKRLLSIVNDILDISKIEAGVVQLNYEKTSINQLLADIEVFYRQMASEKNLELICVKGLKNFDSFITIDKTKLNQVLTNLISNAFKFTNEGKVEFGYELVDKMLRFYVKDTGKGIDKELHHKIFDRFVQADGDFEKHNKGTGLGLAISKRFIELFEGEIWLTSNNPGTTIYFTIPYSKVNAPIVTTVIEKKPLIKEKNTTITILVA
ncbi:MAG: PAS domain S-box protein, partial [Bacteroidetes bacterium]|nr:PAS domain S-box protein [Bacteroidota bacterium]